MAQMTDSFIPPNALLMWADDQTIYVALPTKPGIPPYITKLSRSEGGLAKAFHLLTGSPREAPRPSASAPANYTKVPHPLMKLDKTRAKLHAETTEAQRANAVKLLEKLGIK